MANTVIEARKTVLEAYINSMKNGGAGEDAFNFASALEILENSADFEVALVDIALSFKTTIQDTYAKDFQTQLDAMSAMQTGVSMLPPIYNLSSDYNVYKQLSANEFLFGVVTNGDLSLWLTTNRCLTWKKIAGFSSLGSSDVKYIASAPAGFDVIKETDGTIRLFWVHDNVVYTATLDSVGNYVDVTELTNDLVKGETLRANIAPNGDIAVLFTEKADDKTFSAAYVYRIGGSWRSKKALLDPTGDDINDTISTSRLVVLDDKFYTEITNETDRRYIVMIYKDGDLNDYLFKTADETDTENGLDTGKSFIYGFTKVDDDDNESFFLFTVYEKLNASIIEVTTDLGSYRKLNNIPPQAPANPFTVLEDGTFVTSVKASKDEGNTWFPTYYQVASATKFKESQDILLTSALASGISFIYVTDIKTSTQPNAILKGV